MKIARITVVDGNAFVEMEGSADVPIVVTEGKSLTLELQTIGGQQRHVLRFEWMELGDQKEIVLGITPAA